MSLTNKLVANIKKTNVDIDSFLNTNNVVCIDTSNNRIGINTKTPLYSIDISGDSSSHLINVNKLNIGSLAIIKDISCLNNIDASSAKIKYIAYTTISGTNIISSKITTLSAEILDLSISNLSLKTLKSSKIDVSYLNVDICGTFQNIRVTNLFVDGCFNVSSTITPTYRDIIITGATTVATFNSTQSNMKNIDCSFINVDICANFYNNAFFKNIDLSNGTFRTLSGNTLNVNKINSRDISNSNRISTEFIDCSDTLTVRNVVDQFGKTIINNGALEIAGNTIFADVTANNITVLLSSDISDLQIKNKLYFNENASLILPSYSSTKTITKNLLCDVTDQSMNILKFYNSNNIWSNIYTKTHYATLELNREISGNNISYNTINGNNYYLIENSNNLIIDLTFAKYKYIPIKFKTIKSKEANSGVFSISNISNIKQSGQLVIPDTNGIYEINATISMKYLNSIPGDVEPNTYKFGLYNSYNTATLTESIFDSSYSYVINRNNILTFDNSFNSSSSSLNYIGPLFNYNINDKEGFVFYVSSFKEIDYLVIDNFNATIKLLNY